MEVFTSLIATVGFPIACVIALGCFVWHIYKRSELREDQLRAEIAESQRINAEAVKTLALYSKDITDIKDDIADIKERIN